MWITISSDHNTDSRLRPSATAVHNDGMNSKTKRKHTNGFNEDRLMLISWAAPVLSQLVMLVIMIAQRQWLYVAMLAPGLISSALSLASMALRSNQKQQHDEPVSTTYAKVVETQGKTAIRRSPQCPICVSSGSTLWTRTRCLGAPSHEHGFPPHHPAL